MFSPIIVLPAELVPLTDSPAGVDPRTRPSSGSPLPLSWMTGGPVAGRPRKVRSVVPSRLTWSVIVGRGLDRLMVTKGPGMLKSIVSGPGVALESSIAWRRVVVPSSPNGSAALLTVKVVSSSRSTNKSKLKRTGCRLRLCVRIQRFTRLNSYMVFPSKSRHEEEPGLQPTGQRPTTSRPDLPRRTHRCQLMPASPKLNLATAAFEVVWTPGFVQPDPDLTILTTLIVV